MNPINFLQPTATVENRHVFPKGKYVPDSDEFAAHIKIARIISLVQRDRERNKPFLKSVSFEEVCLFSWAEYSIESLSAVLETEKVSNKEKKRLKETLSVIRGILPDVDLPLIQSTPSFSLDPIFSILL